jgi:hypothetical protein
MNWELYEVWAVDEDGHEELIETTKSLKEAKQIANLNLKEETITKCIIYLENEEGELAEVETIHAG